MANRKIIMVAEDLDDLRSHLSPILDDLAFVKETLEFFDYDTTSLTADDGAAVIKPTHRLTTQPGRWLRRAAAPESFGALKDPGRRAINVLRVASDVADEETVTIGDDVYEFDRADDGVATVGAIPVTGHADDTPAAATDALIDAINTLGSEAVETIDIGNNEILIVAEEVGAVVLACSETLAGANNAWGAAAMYGGAAPATKKLVAQTRVPTAQEVTLGNMHFVFPFAPTVMAVDVRVTATGVAKAWGGSIAVVDNRVTLTNGTDPDWAATDTVKLVVVG